MIRLSRTLILLGEGIFLGICLIILTKIPCPFKMIFKIPCPCCGMTRAFYSILKLDIISSLHYNILLLPFIIILTIINILLVLEIIINKKILPKYFNKKTYKIYITISLILLIFSFIINIYHRI